MTAAPRPHVESVYLRSLDQLEAILASRPFQLGARPSLADFGFFASMFRHFALDPTPAAVMLERAPAVFAWVARLWNARASRIEGELAAGIPGDWSPILREIGEAYLPYLCTNAEAWKARVAALRRGDPGRALSRAAGVALPRLVSGAAARALRGARRRRAAKRAPACSRTTAAGSPSGVSTRPARATTGPARRPSAGGSGCSAPSVGAPGPLFPLWHSICHNRRRRRGRSHARRLDLGRRAAALRRLLALVRQPAGTARPPTRSTA